MSIEEDVMSEEAFNELIDNFEVVEKITMFGRKSIKYYVKKMQAEREQDKKRIQELEEESEIEFMMGYTKCRLNFYKNYIPKQRIKDLIKNETINISGFECIAVEDLEKLFKGEQTI